MNAFFLVLATALAYSSSLSGAFVFDDITDIVENPVIRSLWPVSLTARPLVDLTFALNYQLGGLNPWGYHFVNWVIHVLAALVLFGILRRTLRMERIAFVTALLWALHPLQTQSVTYVIQRGESLAGLFYLLTLYTFIRGAQSSKRFWYGLSALSCFAGMGCKPVMVTAPLIILLYDRIFISSSFRALVRKHGAVYAAYAVSWIFLGLLVQQTYYKVDELSAGFGYQKVTPLQYFMTQPEVILHYLRLSFWPSPLCADYLWPKVKVMSQAAGPMILVSGLFMASLVSFWKAPKVGFLGAWFFLILAPTSSFMPIADAAVEHRMYLSLIPVMLGLVFILERLLRKAVLFRTAVTLLTLTFGVLTFQRNQIYASEVAFWSDVLVTRPDNFRAHSALGNALFEAGRVRDAHAHYDRAIAIQPRWYKAHYNRGVALMKQGETDQALASFQRAIQIRPDYAEAHNNLGVMLSKMERHPEAIRHFMRSIEVNPDSAEAHNNLANNLFLAGQLEEAASHYQTALKLDPDYIEAKANLGKLLGRLKNKPNE